MPGQLWAVRYNRHDPEDVFIVLDNGLGSALGLRGEYGQIPIDWAWSARLIYEGVEGA